MSDVRYYWSPWLRWERGRQNTGYDKLLLAVNPFLIPFDCYLLRFPAGSEIPPHREPARIGPPLPVEYSREGSPAVSVAIGRIQ